jgi:RNA polymerase sigma factor (sigma-70 family)
MAEPVDIIPTRQSLLSRLKDWNDQESWRVFFDTYWRLIYGAARKAGLTDAEAQDVVQETILCVSKQMPNFQYNAQGSFKGWLMRLTSWRVADQFRKRQPGSQHRPTDTRTDTGTDPLERLEDPASQVLEQHWEDEWESNLMEVAVERVKRQVNPKQYQIFDFHVRQGWPVSRVAHALKVSAARVYVTKHRITHLIQKEVTRLRSRSL